jgi:hypothetical protein
MFVEPSTFGCGEGLATGERVLERGKLNCSSALGFGSRRKGFVRYPKHEPIFCCAKTGAGSCSCVCYLPGVQVIGGSGDRLSIYAVWVNE